MKKINWCRLFFWRKKKPKSDRTEYSTAFLSELTYQGNTEDALIIAELRNRVKSCTKTISCLLSKKTNKPLIVKHKKKKVESEVGDK